MSVPCRQKATVSFDVRHPKRVKNRVVIELHSAARDSSIKGQQWVTVAGANAQFKFTTFLVLHMCVLSVHLDTYLIIFEGMINYLSMLVFSSICMMMR